MSATEPPQLARWNDTSAPYPRDKCIQELFTLQAARTPDAVAVMHGRMQLTYRELDERSSQLAHHLRNLGVAPEVIVALCMERSPEMIIGLLGILKAGGAYLPLDPDYPSERMSFMLEDAGVTVSLTQGRLGAQLPRDRLRILRLDADRADWAGCPRQSPPAGARADNLAYVIHTSGSTGRPKGVMVEHRQVLKLVAGEPCVRIGADDVLVYCANPTFDASTWEIWGALLNGARLAIFSPQQLLDPEVLDEALASSGATILQLTAGLLGAYAEEGVRAFGRLRYLLFGGDRADLNAVRQIRDRNAPAHLLHTYGPTETVAFAVACEVPVGPLQSLPIGRPLANTQLYILDGDLEPVPVGIAGELYIGGESVARGYLRRPELTAERFIPHPFRRGERMYRTGDRARYLPDGQVEFLGRCDDQVKIRGYRIEPGEIEAALRSHPGVNRALVVARKQKAGDLELVAYYSAAGPLPDLASLRAHLLKSLPRFMLPAAFVPLQHWPLSANGKLDRAALPAP